MSYFKYGNTEIAYLSGKDKKLGVAIKRIGMLKRAIKPDPFEALLASIISQQISSKAAETVWKRFLDATGQLTPQSILSVDKTIIQKCGMSMKKTEYLLGIAEAAHSGNIDFKSLASLEDNEIITSLSALKGIGVWTVEMLLIFSLCRPDVVSYDDLAIRRGMMKLYGLKTLTKQQFERYRKRYSPYGSVASLYLWALSVES